MIKGYNEMTDEQLQRELKELDDHWERLDHSGAHQAQDKIIHDMDRIRSILRDRGVTPKY